MITLISNKKKVFANNDSHHHMFVCDAFSKVIRLVLTTKTPENVTRILFMEKKQVWLSNEGAMKHPLGICLMKNNFIAFVCDADSNCIKMLNLKQKTIATIAGGRKAGHRDGNGTNAQFNYPYAIVSHKSKRKLFISDCCNHVIREIDILTLSPNLSLSNTQFEVKTCCGAPKSKGLVDGVGTNAKLFWPRGLAFSNLNENILFISESGNASIRKLDLQSRMLTTYFIPMNGNKSLYDSRGICVDNDDNLYICASDCIIKVEINKQMSAIEGFICKASANELSSSNEIDISTPMFIAYDSQHNSLIFTQSLGSICKIQLRRPFLEVKLSCLFRLYRLLANGCQKRLKFQLLLNLISFSILQISSNPFCVQQLLDLKKKVLEYAADKATLQNMKSLSMKGKRHQTFIQFVLNGL